MESFLPAKDNDDPPSHRIPDDLWTEIFLDLCGYPPDLFGNKIEYGISTVVPCPLSQFAAGPVLVNKQFYNIAMPILWRNVVIRSPASFGQIATLAVAYGHHTWRLELRLEHLYHLPLIYEVVSHMPNLSIFLNRNFTRCLTPLVKTDPECIVDALSSYAPELRRIQLDAEWEYPSVDQVRRLLNAKPSLQALRISAIAYNNSTVFSIWKGQAPLLPRRPLRTLSLGAAYWLFSSEYRERAMASFLSMITASDALPLLSTVHHLENTSFSPAFFTKYGPQLTELMYVPGNPHSFHSWEYNCPQFSNFCPQLRRTIWFIKNWNTVDPENAIPRGHRNTTSAEIIYHKLEPELPAAFEETARRILSSFLSGDFPRIEELYFVPRGGTLPDFKNALWFRQLEEDLKMKHEYEGGAHDSEVKRGVVVYVE